MKSQKDLGVVVTENLNWTANANRRFYKAKRALWYLKRSMSNKTSVINKLNAYKGYVVPIISYASEVWHPNKKDLVLLEKLQKNATKWILGNPIDYKTRLFTLNILPLAMYLEPHSLLLYCNIADGEYNINVNQFIKYNTNEKTRQGTYEVIVAKTRLCKTDEILWIRTAIYNIFCRITDLKSKSKGKERITSICTQFLRKLLMENDPCTWRVCCLYKNCNIHTKPI